MKALMLNVLLVIVLLTSGIVAQSNALLANGLDNLSDAAVYGLSYFALLKGIQWQIRAARVSGVMLIILAVGVTIESIRGFLYGSEPVGLTIIIMSIVAAIINVLSLKVLKGTRTENVNLRAAWKFSINDLLANLGALVAGVLVIVLRTNIPDLIVGMLVALYATKEGIEILRDAKNEAENNSDAKV